MDIDFEYTDLAKAGHDDSALSDSNEDPDWTPGSNTQPQSQLYDSSSSVSDENVPVTSSSADLQTKRKLLWKTIQNESCYQYIPPSYQLQLNTPHQIKSPIEQFVYF